MGKIYLLASVHDLPHLTWIGKREFNFSGQVIRVSDFKENELSISEIISNPLRSRGDHGLAQSKVFENTSRRVYFREGITMIGNNAEIATINRLNDLPAILYTEIFDVLLQPALSN